MSSDREFSPARTSETPAQRDLGSARPVLTDWLRKKLPRAEGLSLGEIALPKGNGGSNETLMFDAHWNDGGRRDEGMVVRIAPVGHRIFLELDFERQYRIMQLLSEHTNVPMPRMRWYESDASILGAPFWAMARVEGQVPSDFPPFAASGFIFEAQPQEREKLWLSAMDALTRIHAVDSDELGFLAKPERGATGLEQQVDYWSESCDWTMRQAVANPIAEATREWLLANLPAERPTSLSWGDARLGNMMFRDFECVAVFDWEMVSLGGALMDLGWWIFLDYTFGEDMGVARLSGIGSREDSIALWEERTGRRARDLEWYEAFAGFRLAVIIQRSHQLRILAGVPNKFPEDHGINNSCTRRLARMLGLPGPGA